MTSLSSESLGLWVPQAPPTVNSTQFSSQTNGRCAFKDAREPTGIKTSKRWRDDAFAVPEISPPSTASKRSGPFYWTPRLILWSANFSTWISEWTLFLCLFWIYLKFDLLLHHVHLGLSGFCVSWFCPYLSLYLQRDCKYEELKVEFLLILNLDMYKATVFFVMVILLMLFGICNRQFELSLRTKI